MKPLKVALFLLFLSGIVFAQTLEEQFQAADAELNRVYKELRSQLNEEQKDELKKSQLAWIKEKDRLAKQASTSDQRQQFLTQVTIERTQSLSNAFAHDAATSKPRNIQSTYSKDADYQTADEELNRVYQQLRSQLNDGEKSELKTDQIRWINDRDLKANNAISGELKTQILIELTNNRVNYLKQELKNKSEKNATKKQYLETPDEIAFASGCGLKVVYQSTVWDEPTVVCEAQNETYRAISKAGSNKIYVFDKRSRLMLGEFAGDAGQLFETDPYHILYFTKCGKYIYGEKPQHKGVAFTFTHIPSLIPAMQRGTYRSQPIAPIGNHDGFVGWIEEPMGNDDVFFKAGRNYRFLSMKAEFDQLKESEKEINYRKNEKKFIDHFPYLSEKIGQFLHVNPPNEYGVNNLSYDKEIIIPNVTFFSSDSSSGFSAYNEPLSDRKSHQIESIDVSGGIIQMISREKSNDFKLLEMELKKLQSAAKHGDSDLVLNPLLEGNLRGYPPQEKDAVVFLKNKNMDLEIYENGYISNTYPNIAEFKFNNSNGLKIPKENNNSHRLQMAKYYNLPCKILVAYWIFPGKGGTDYRAGIYNIETQKCIYKWDNNREGRSVSETPRHFYCKDSNAMWVSENSSIREIDTKSGKIKNEIKMNNTFEVFAVKENMIVGMPRMDEKVLEVWQQEPLVKKCDVMWDDNMNLVLVTPEAFYTTKAKNFGLLAFRSYSHAYPFEQFDLRLNRPDIVLERLGAPDEAIAIAKQLREKRLKRMGVTEDMLQPDFHLPEIEILGDLPSSTEESDLALKIKASDSKYPLDRLRLYVNNVPVNGKEGELLRDSKSQSLERTIPIKLAAGRNKIQISVLNSAGAESLYANAEVTCTAQRPKPTLYAVAMGVSEYANPDWNLKYAAKDAQDILERVKTRSGSSYGEIKELLLTDREATKESLGKIREFLSKATVDDTVLLFVAGHGLLDSKYDYYFGTSNIDFNNPSANGIAFEEFDDLLAELPCLRKSLLIDTCHAGELDEDEKKMLASAQANPSQVVAMLPTGARGMTIKPIEGARGKSEWYDRLQGLFVDLRRGSGSTILSSSAGAEYALESSEQKNGLFTYAVLEALDGKEGSDANKDGSVTMSELADYVKTRVAALTNNKQSPNVRRVNLEADFALSKK